MNLRTETGTIKAVILDWDGTLIDTIPYKMAQNQELARKFGRIFTREQLRTIWNESSGFNELMFHICGTDDMSVVMPRVKEDYDKPEFAKRSFGYSNECLVRLKNSLARCAMITNANREILALDENALGLGALREYFTVIQTVDDWEYKKPHPRVFENVLKLLGVQASDAVYIGDELKDYEAARDAGVNFIGVETGLCTKNEFKQAGAISVATLPDALKVVGVS